MSESEQLVGPKIRPDIENDSLMRRHQNTGWKVTIRYFIPLPVLLIVLTGAIQAQDTASPEQLFARGVESLKQGRLEEAETAFLDALQKGMDNAFLHHNLGIVYQQQRLHEEAAGEFREALARDPDFQASRALLGTSLLALRRTDEGIKELELATRSLADNPMLRIQLANAYEANGQTLKAAGQYREIVRQHPDDPESAYQLGKAYLAVSEWCYSRMASVAPNSARVHQAMGQNLMGLGDFEAAARAFQKAIKSDPELPDLHLALAHALLRQGRLAEALEAVEAELAIVPWNVGAQRMKAQIRTRLESTKEQ